MYSFQLRDLNAIPSPALLFSLEAIRNNLSRMVVIAGSASRLRPHMKTHKTREITKLYLDRGITKHKCATLAEAEVLAGCGVRDILIAYPMVGPNQMLLLELAGRFPEASFSILGDDVLSLHELQQKAVQSNVALGLFLDVNVGQDRSGATVDQMQAFCGEVVALAKQSDSFGLKLQGLHLYDGHNTSTDIQVRKALAEKTVAIGVALKNQLEQHGSNQLQIVLGGTPVFEIYSNLATDSYFELSPGTCILHDAGYGQKYPELGFEPAAAVLTRCISRPGERLVTFDVGTKAICSDPPAGQRCMILGLEGAKAVLHNEEHLVMETDHARSWKPGQIAYAVPAHVCPTVALYEWATVIECNNVLTQWRIAARNRFSLPR